ncbi:tetratricopeptide repeat protein, partial [Klebsiella pneumoniae]|uniref:tetratricopeptide repeat protein n=1 Tax=Klebsiella pneumoniae TaxID=573 RepID=UPI00385467A7
MQLDDKAGAAADADRALTLAPLNEEALGLRVGLYEAMGERAKAIALLSDALKRLPESPDLRDVLVNLDLAAGDP